MTRNGQVKSDWNEMICTVKFIHAFIFLVKCFQDYLLWMNYLLSLGKHLTFIQKRVKKAVSNDSLITETYRILLFHNMLATFGQMQKIWLFLDIFFFDGF